MTVHRVLKTTSGESALFWGRAGELLPDLLTGYSKICVLTDSEVSSHHGALFPKGAEVIALSPGEGSKTLEQVKDLYASFARRRLDRNSLLLAVGGGVITDLAGYVGATYMRGVPVGFVPTTLLAQVDAALGGKNGVNHLGAKNLIGTIRQPLFVLMDHELTKTLSKREWTSGLCEVVKAAAIGDRELFEELESCGASLAAPGSLSLAQLERAANVKLGLVQKDESDHGVRRLLNFGHTLGHAIEASEQIPHGEAVARGMVFAARLSERLVGLPNGELLRLVQLLDTLGLPTQGLLQRGHEQLLTRDKKRSGDCISFVLLRTLGDATLQSLPLPKLMEVLDDLRES